MQSKTSSLRLIPLLLINDMSKIRGIFPLALAITFGILNGTSSIDDFEVLTTNSK